MTQIKKGFKGYNKDLKCRDFQYEIGKEYAMEGEPKACEKGFHFCENPFDVWNYYPPTNGNRFTEVETDGILHSDGSDSKQSSNKLKVGIEFNLKSFVEGAVKFIFEQSKEVSETPNKHLRTTGYRANAATTGYRANAATTGYYANAATTGYRANAATTGYSANAATTGNYANAATTGYSANAATTGNYANAATTGYRANAATTGNYANAATTGYRANAATTGNYANAATTGNYANAATTGYRANAATTGNYANAATTGEGANAATTGEGANAATTGYSANAATTGENTVSAAIGIMGAAKATIGSWIVVSEWVQDKDYKWLIKEVKTAKIDGEILKADTFYKLENGNFVVCE